MINWHTERIPDAYRERIRDGGWVPGHTILAFIKWEKPFLACGEAVAGGVVVPDSYDDVKKYNDDEILCWVTEDEVIADCAEAQIE